MEHFYLLFYLLFSLFNFSLFFRFTLLLPLFKKKIKSKITFFLIFILISVKRIRTSSLSNKFRRQQGYFWSTVQMVRNRIFLRFPCELSAKAWHPTPADFRRSFLRFFFQRDFYFFFFLFPFPQTYINSLTERLCNPDCNV